MLQMHKIYEYKHNNKYNINIYESSQHHRRRVFEGRIPIMRTLANNHETL